MINFIYLRDKYIYINVACIEAGPLKKGRFLMGSIPFLCSSWCRSRSLILGGGRSGFCSGGAPIGMHIGKRRHVLGELL